MATAPRPAAAVPDRRGVAHLRPFRLAILSSLLLLAGLGQEAPTTRPATSPATAPTSSRARHDNLVAWLTIGGSSRDQARRQVGFKIDQYGWQGYIKFVADPAVRLMRAGGYKPRIVVCNPFGTLAGEAMQFDQRLHAEEGVAGVHPPLPWLHSGFEEAWASYLSANPDVEAICYLGTLDTDPDFVALEAPERRAEWIARFDASIRPALKTRMAVGFDASAVVKADRPAWGAMQMVRNLGTTVYVEARPIYPHLAGWPVIAIDTTYRRTDPARFPDSAAVGHLPNEQLGSTMLLFTSGTVEERKTRIRAAAAEGLDVSVPAGDVRWAMEAMASSPSD